MILLTYFTDLVRVFFKWWWAVITAIATFFPLLTLPTSITVNKNLLAVGIFRVCILLFLTLSVVIQGHKWYLGSHNAPKVVTCLAATTSGHEGEASDEVITINSVHDLEMGQILTMFRETNRGVGCLGIIKVGRRLGTHTRR
jgi:ABC-type sugar transport system permease subunit